MSRTVNERACALGSLLATIALAALLVAGPALIPSTGVVMAQMAKVDICHQNADGQYVKISVAEAAYQTHVNHGDGSVGDPIPGLTGYEFDEDCLPQESQCPCFSATDVADVIAGWGPGVLLSDQDHEGGFYETTLIALTDPSFMQGPQPLFDAIHLDGSIPYCAVWTVFGSGFMTTATSAEAAVCRTILLDNAP